MFSWTWTDDWLQFVELARSLRCKFDSTVKSWVIPNRKAAVALVKALVEREGAATVQVWDFASGLKISPLDYIGSGRPRVPQCLPLPFRCDIEAGGAAYLSMPYDPETKETPPEYALALGLAVDGCKGSWVEGRGFRLEENVQEALGFLRESKLCPVEGAPPPELAEPLVLDFHTDIMLHQRRGVSFLASRPGGALLADEMGLGKSMQSILAADQLKADGVICYVLLVVPVSLVGNWRYELARWGSSFKEGRDLKILPYSKLHHYRRADSGLRKELLAAGQGGKLLVIADEAHYLKNASSQRSKEFLRLVAETQARPWLLTGTPITRDNANLWPLATALQHPIATKYMPSQMASMKGQETVRLFGALCTHMLLRKKEGILDIPAKVRQMISVTVGWNQWLTDKICEGILEEDDKEKAMEHLMALKRLSAFAKAEYTVEQAREILAAGRKVVIFSDHIQPMRDIVAALASYGAEYIDGTVKPSERTAIVERFQNDPSLRVFVGQIKAAGVGITLTAAHDVIFNDMTWLPADMQQAEDRCHRIGTTKQVVVRYIVDDDMPMDDILSTKLAERSAEIATFEQSRQLVLTGVKQWLKQRKDAKKAKSKAQDASPTL